MGDTTKIENCQYIDKLNKTLTVWITALKLYDFGTLVEKPDADNWSLGQVFSHLIIETNFYIEQIEYCLTHSENCSEQMAATAVLIFASNEFPDERIKNDSPSARDITQPKNKPGLLKQMLHIKTQLNLQWNKIIDDKALGKTKHPGLGYFNAREWFQFAELHLRHHLRQKTRIENAIRSTRPLQRKATEHQAR